jgi:hypothetical protein
MLNISSGIPILMSRRDGAIVAWHEVPREIATPKSRPVGYGVIRASVRIDSVIGVRKLNAVSLSRMRSLNE